MERRGTWREDDGELESERVKEGKRGEDRCKGWEGLGSHLAQPQNKLAWSSETSADEQEQGRGGVVGGLTSCVPRKACDGGGKEEKERIPWIEM